MADLKPLGSEKLQGMDKIRRILEIASYNDVPKNNINEVETTNYTIRLSDGNVYGIVKEKLGYIIKSGINESTLNYSDPMRHRKYYRSYSEAMKRLNIMANEINRVTGHKEEIPLIGEDVKKKYLTEKKFVLKQNKPEPKTEETPPPPAGGGTTPPPPPAAGGTTPPPPPAGGEAPTDMGMGDTGAGGSPDMGMGDTGAGGAPDMGMGDTGAGGSPDMGMGDTGAGGSPDMGMGDTGAGGSPDMGGAPDMGMGEPETPQPSIEGEESEQPMGPTGLKTIQKLTGRLSQRLRSFEKMKSEDIKYVINSIISAIDLAKLDDEDRDDILDKLESFDEYGAEGPGELDLSDEEDLDMGMGEPMGVTDDMGMGGDSMNKPPVSESRVQNILTGYFNFKPEEKRIYEEKKQRDFLKEKLKKIEIENEIKSLSESKKQMEVALGFINENAKFIGRTNKENLVFTKNGRQFKVTPRGAII